MEKAMQTNQLPPFIDYLLSKKSVDDRALNLRVWNQFAESLQKRAAVNERLEILEVGGGIGTMLARLLENKALPNCCYTLVDTNAENIAYAQIYLENWAAKAGCRFERVSDGKFRLMQAQRQMEIETICGDIFPLLAAQPAAWDTMIAHAVLDLFHLPSALPRLLDALQPGGLFYTTINYDGLTIFEPPLLPDFETQILARYNQTMDERHTDGLLSGDSRAGRHLFGELQQHGVEILAAGSSDWVIYANNSGYAHNEGVFLQHLLNFIETEMRRQPDIDAGLLERWIATRRQQIAGGELFCIVHQMDYLGMLRALP